MMYLMIAAGLVLLFVGGEALVRGSVSVARKLNISELVIGLTLVGFGTSVPELVTSLQAVGQGAVGISIGNVVGSNIANVLLVLAIAVILSPIVVHPNAIMRDGLVMVGATALLCGLLWFDQFNRISGFVLLVLLISYLVFSLLMDQRRQDATADMHREEGEGVDAQYGLGLGLLIAVIGLAGVVAGANLLVEGSVTLVFVLDEDGRVEDPRVENSTRPEFEKPALEAVRKWRFQPGMKDGQPVRTYIRVPIRFSVSTG